MDRTKRDAPKRERGLGIGASKKRLEREVTRAENALYVIFF